MKGDNDIEDNEIKYEIIGLEIEDEVIKDEIDEIKGGNVNVI